MHASDIFNLNQAEPSNQLFSIGGSPSFRITRRHESNSSVFPSGCMGNATDATLLARQQVVDSAKQETLAQVHKEHPFGDQCNKDDYLDEDLETSRRETNEEVAADDTLNEGANAAAYETHKNIPEVDEIGGGESATKMYQYMGSNIARNPLTGSGMLEPAGKSGKRSIPAHDKGVTKKWVW